PYQRGQINGQATTGATPTQIAESFELDRGTVRYTIQQDKLRHEGNSIQRPQARKKSYTDADERLLLRHVRTNPKDTYAQVKTACGLTFSTTTIKRILKEHGITN
ncbi:hypothetical protein BJ875DRAFT_454042, partial [Amylocarpus encephaloides]